jgi:hypothetical protein
MCVCLCVCVYVHMCMYVYIVGKGQGGGAREQTREQTLGRAATAGKPDGGAGSERASTAAERSSVGGTSPMLSLACHVTRDPRHGQSLRRSMAMLFCWVLGLAAHHLS